LVSGSGICLAPAPPDQLIAAIAAAQHGRVARTQLLAAGVDRHAIDRRIKRRYLIPRHAGVYLLGHAAPTDLGDETAALLAIGPTGLLSGHSAATLCGLRAGTARPIHVTVPFGRQGPGPDGVIVHRSRTLAPQDATVIRGLPVTSPARTMLDLAATLPDRDVGYILAQGLDKRLLTEPVLADVIRRAGGHHGAQALARAMSRMRGVKVESRKELRLLELIRAADLPVPETQGAVLGFRADLIWRDLRLVVEVDTFGTHGGRAAFERDRVRDAKLEAAAYTVIRFTDIQIEREPYAVIARLSQVIGHLSSR
jgi:very-short-patch-repair endonuclease